MTDLINYRVTDGIDDVLAVQYNRVIDATVRAELSNIESLAANKTLVDADYPLQVLTPTAARNVTLPAVAATNHPYYIINASATYALTVRNAGGSTIGIVALSSSGSFASDGTAWHSFGGGGLPSPGTSGNVLMSNGSTWTSSAAIREKLTGARTYYVRSDGSNSNDGLADSAGGAYLTFAHAMSIVSGSIDFGGFAVTIKMGTATWAVALAVTGWTGGGTLTLDGNGAANTIISTASNCISATTNVLPGTVFIKNMKLVSSAASGIYMTVVGKILMQGGMEFGACTGLAHIAVLTTGATFEFGTAYTISGSSPNHYYGVQGAHITCNNNLTITLSGSPVFSAAFTTMKQTSKFYTAGAMTFSGSAGATTVRYNATLNAVIDTQGGGASYFPGTSAGTTSTGGQYA